MDLSKLTPSYKRKSPLRKGRGTGSGLGKTAGRGNKGAGQRAGKKTPYIGFRGGNLPFTRRIPKRGFNSYVPIETQIVNLESLSVRFKDQSVIDPEALKKANLIKDAGKPIKVLAKVKSTYNIKNVIKADKFSAKAKELIEKAGGKAEILSR